MELNLKKYSSNELLCSYEFVFAQYISGEFSQQSDCANIPTVYIFRELCSELRRQYLLRNDAKTEHIISVENDCVQRISVMLNMSEKKLVQIYNEYLEKLKEHNHENNSR